MAEENQGGAPTEDKPAATAEAPAGAAAATGLMETLKTNATARYVLIGAVVVVILALFLGGGDDVKKAPQAVTAVGQTVTLENPNGGMSHLTVVPGLVSASDAEEDKEQSVCLVKAGTKGQVEEEQIVSMLPFVKLKILDGECQGKSGWTSKINIKAG